MTIGMHNKHCCNERIEEREKERKTFSPLKNVWRTLLRNQDHIQRNGLSLTRFRQDLGSRCGTLGRVVAGSNTRGPGFEFSHQQFLYRTFSCIEKTKHKEKSGREWDVEINISPTASTTMMAMMMDVKSRTLLFVEITLTAAADFRILNVSNFGQIKRHYLGT